MNMKKFKAKYKEFIAEVAINNDVDMGVGCDMLIKMVCEPNDDFREKAIENYHGIPEDLNQEEFIADYQEVIDGE